MEEEISLMEILATLWQGKYVILIITATALLIAFLASLFLVEPLYEAKTNIDPTPYGFNNSELIKLVDHEAIIETVLSSAAGESDVLSGKFVLLESDSFIEIRVTASNPGKAAYEAEKIGTALRDLAIDNQRERLSEQREIHKRQIQFIGKLISDMYGATIEENDLQNLQTDPIYINIMEEKSVYILELNEVMFQLSELDYYMENLDHDHQISPITVSQQPINIRWKLNTAVAGALGLMLSILAIFIWPYLKELSAFIGSKASER